MELRQYQKEAIQAINDLPDGSRSVCCLATGLGKTVVAANIEHHGRVLWLSHRDELVKQPERYYMENGLSFGIEKAESHEAGEDIVSASVQSISRDNRLSKFDPNAFDIIICDEAHHAAAPTYKKVLQYFHPRKLIGLTATPKRGDGIKLTDVFDSICFVRDLKWGIENGYLTPIRCVQVKADYDMNELKRSMGDFTVSSIEKLYNGSDADIVLTKAYMDYCLAGKRQTLIYCPTVSVCWGVYSTMINALPEKEKKTIRVLSDKTDPEERAKILKEYQEGTVHCIINCMILTEGTDLPGTSCIINNRPTANASLYQQMVGRGTRLAEGKENCLIIDIVGNNARYKQLCTAPTLFGIEPDELPDEITRQINEETDLLELSRDIASLRAETAKSLQIKYTILDLFGKQRTDLLKKHGSNAKAIAKDYRELLEQEKASEYDFGDLIVRRMYTDEHYYRIQATYKGYVFLSKPDMLGKTVIDMHIPAGDMAPDDEIDFISEPVDLGWAIAWIRDILDYIIPGKYLHKWSDKTRTEIVDLPCTKKQEWRLKNVYHLNSAGMTKMEASDVIDMFNEITETREEKQELKQQQKNMRLKRSSQRSSKKIEKLEKQKYGEYLLFQNRKDRYLKQKEEIDRKIAKKKRLEKDLWNSVDQAMQFSFEPNYKYFLMSNPPTDRQMHFMKEILLDMKNKNLYINKIMTIHDVTSGEMGLILDLLIQAKEQLRAPDPLRIVLDTKSLIGRIRELKKGSRPSMLQCGYTVKDMSEMAKQ